MGELSFSVWNAERVDLGLGHMGEGLGGEEGVEIYEILLEYNI